MKTRFFLMIAIVLFAGIPGAFSQRGYTEFKTEDNIKVMYRWQRLQPFNRDSDMVLNLRVTNLSESHVVLNYSINFYNENFAIFESEKSSLCLKPGQSLRGGFADLRFAVDGMKRNIVESETFSWDFFEFDVEEVENCD
jgi:hypothetical protein